MGRCVVGVTALALLLIVTLSSTVSHAAEIDLFRADYSVAQATFNIMNGCVLQQARISADDAREYKGSVVVRDNSTLFVEVGEYDSCDNFRPSYVRMAIQQVPADVFFVEPSLGKARLVINFTVCNQFPNDGQCRVVSINLTWASVATADNETITHHSRLNPPETQAEHLTLRSVPANVTGSITDGVTEYAAIATTGFILIQHEGIVAITPGS
jgi:hypothetical protein